MWSPHSLKTNIRPPKGKNTTLSLISIIIVAGLKTLFFDIVRSFKSQNHYVWLVGEAYVIHLLGYILHINWLTLRVGH